MVNVINEIFTIFCDAALSGRFGLETFWKPFVEVA